MRVVRAMLVLVGTLSLPTIGWGQNACITCHSALPPAQQKTHSFADWSPSAHARAGVSCEQCHGGNPTAAAQDAAHRGMLASSQPKSPVYFTQIPQTCGACHAEEFAAFKESYHYKELLRSGRGPNCVTCHGAMATRIVHPQQMEQTCVLCHTKPTAAGEALVTLNQAGALLRAWENISRQRSGRPPADAAQLLQAQRMYEAVQRKWHAFKMAEVLQDAKAIVQMARKATAEGLPQGAKE